MGLLSVFKKKPKQDPSWQFSISREQLEQMVQWQEVPALQKLPNTMEFTALDEKGDVHHFVYRTKKPLACPVFGFLAEQAHELCEKRRYLLHSLSSYATDGSTASMGHQILFAPGPVWLYKSCEEYDGAERRYLEEKNRRERIYELAKAKGFP